MSLRGGGFIHKPEEGAYNRSQQRIVARSHGNGVQQWLNDITGSEEMAE